MVHKLILAMLYVAWRGTAHGLAPSIITILLFIVTFCAKSPKAAPDFAAMIPRGDPNCNRIRNYFHQRKNPTSSILEAASFQLRSRFSRSLFPLSLNYRAISAAIEATTPTTRDEIPRSLGSFIFIRGDLKAWRCPVDYRGVNKKSFYIPPPWTTEGCWKWSGKYSYVCFSLHRRRKQNSILVDGALRERDRVYWFIKCAVYRSFDKTYMDLKRFLPFDSFFVSSYVL